MKGSTSTLPALIPAGWHLTTLPTGPALLRDTPWGLRAIFSVDHSAGDGINGIEGPYAHMSISRRNKYPDWDEMRDLVYSCGLFDNTRDVYMVLPRKEDYVNVHNNCFHFWQLVTSS